MSACGTTAMGRVAVLFAACGPAVWVPAVVDIDHKPMAGAVNMAVQVMLLPTLQGSGAGLGTQTGGVPAGSPDSVPNGASVFMPPSGSQLQRRRRQPTPALAQRRRLHPCAAPASAPGRHSGADRRPGQQQAAGNAYAFSCCARSTKSVVRRSNTSSPTESGLGTPAPYSSGRCT